MYHKISTLKKSSKLIKNERRKIKIHNSNEYFASKENQTQFMDDLFTILSYNTLEDWQKLSTNKLFQNGGQSLLNFYYQRDTKKLLSSIYPNYPWEWKKIPQRSYFNDIDNQREFMDKLSKKLKLKSLEKWMNIKKKKIIEEGGKGLILYYSNDWKSLLLSIYPNYPWPFLDSPFYIENHLNNSNNAKNNNNNNNNNNNKSVNVDNMENSNLSIESENEKIIVNNINNKNKIIRENTIIVSSSSKEEFFKSIENQNNYLEYLYHKFEFKSFDDWYKISIKKIRQNNGNTLIENYSNDIKKMLIFLFPNYPWNFNNEINFNILSSHRMIMEKIFIKLNLKTKKDWEKITKSKFISKGGEKILNFYQNDVQKMFSSIYPNEDWNFDVSNWAMDSFQSIDFQRNFMEKLFLKLNLKSIEDWNSVSKEDLIENGGKRLLNHYKNDMKKLLSSLFPDKSHNNINDKFSMEYFQSHSNQLNFMNNLFRELKLTRLDDWVRITRKKLRQNGGNNLLLLYSNNMKKLLNSIYPQHRFYFNDLKIECDKLYFKSIYNQGVFMNYLFKKLKLKSYEDWKNIKKEKFLRFGGKELLKSYSKDLRKLLSTIYVNYPWHFDQYHRKGKEYFQSLENRQKFMDYLFNYFQLKSLDDWIYLSQREFIINGGKNLMFYYRNFHSLLREVYPHFPWHFETKIIIQFRKQMQKLFVKLKLRKLSDWLRISIKKLKRKGGKKLLEFFNDNLKNLLLTIYPNYHWKFDWIFENLSIISNNNYFLSIDNQRDYMNHLYDHLKLKSIDEWLKVSRSKFIQNRGKNLLYYYNEDITKLLSSIYPLYQWNFDQVKFKSKAISIKSIEYIKEKIISLQRIYLIKEKKDWYRINIYINDVKKNLCKSLKILHPDQHWSKKQFQFRSKKTNQRVLLSYIERIFSSHLLLENYRHPKFQSDGLLEIDIFIPQLNIGFEYQGEQHYNDMPSIFSPFESSMLRDSLKKGFAVQFGVKLIPIPYWWDHSLPSLISTFRYSIFNNE